MKCCTQSSIWSATQLRVTSQIHSHHAVQLCTKVQLHPSPFLSSSLTPRSSPCELGEVFRSTSNTRVRQISNGINNNFTWNEWRCTTTTPRMAQRMKGWALDRAGRAPSLASWKIPRNMCEIHKLVSARTLTSSTRSAESSAALQIKNQPTRTIRTTAALSTSSASTATSSEESEYDMDIGGTSLPSGRWQTKYTLPNNWVIRGSSTSRKHTGFLIENHRIYLDAGVGGNYVYPHTVLISHGHWDHCNSLASHLRHCPQPPLVAAPVQIMERLFTHVKSSYALKFDIARRLPRDCALHPPAPFVINQTLEGDMHAVWHPVGPGSEFRLRQPKNVIVRAIKLYHTTPTCGYILSEEREKLKPEFQSWSGKEIAQHRKKGNAVMGLVRVPALAFVCDTSSRVFQDAESAAAILACPTVMIECTFLEKELESEANQRGHICWSQLRPIVAANPNTTFILFHFSRRYHSNEEIVSTFRKQQTESFPNVRLWLEGAVVTP